MVPTWPVVLYAVAAAVVWWDAHRLGITFGGPSGRDGSLGAPGWAMITLLMAPIAVPIYIWRRRRWLPELGAGGRGS